MNTINVDDCKHEITSTEWQDGGWDEYEHNDWIDGEWIEQAHSTFEDICTHRYGCTQCGIVFYYSGAARDFFENGIECNIPGLNYGTQIMSKITVTVSGFAGVGKSTIASVIASALGREGVEFDVVLLDGELPNDVHTEIRLDSIKERGLHVDIVERSTPRASINAEDEETALPWLRGALKDWSICGMNHYHINGVKFIYVSMTRGTKCVTMEGKDDELLWRRLQTKAGNAW